MEAFGEDWPQARIARCEGGRERSHLGARDFDTGRRGSEVLPDSDRNVKPPLGLGRFDGVRCREAIPLLSRARAMWRGGGGRDQILVLGAECAHAGPGHFFSEEVEVERGPTPTNCAIGFLRRGAVGLHQELSHPHLT